VAVGFRPVVLPPPTPYVTTDTLAAATGRLPLVPVPSLVFYPPQSQYYSPVIPRPERSTTLTHPSLNVAAIQQYSPHVRRISVQTHHGIVDIGFEKKSNGPLVPHSSMTSTLYGGCPSVRPVWVLPVIRCVCRLQSSLQHFPWSGSIVTPATGRFRLSSSVGQQVLQWLGTHIHASGDLSVGTCLCVTG
jgi:hypothetical protein